MGIPLTDTVTSFLNVEALTLLAVRVGLLAAYFNPLLEVRTGPLKLRAEILA